MPLQSSFERALIHLPVLTASIPFAGSGEYYSEMVYRSHRHREPLRKTGTHRHFNRRNFTGRRVAKVGDYEPAVALGHTAVMCLSEVTGAIHPDAVQFLKSLAALHGNKLPVALVGQSWTATTFIGYFLQRLSSAVNMAAAQELRGQISTAPRLQMPPRGGRRYRSFARA